MDAVLNPVVQELLKLGLPGIVIVFLAIAYWRKDLALSSCQDQRVSDVKELTETITQNTAATREHTQALDRLTLVFQKR